MEEKYKEFLNYSYADNEQYRRYIDSIEPPPPLSKIPYYRKKFYRQYVDKDFDISYDPDKKPEPSPPQPEEKKHQEESPKEERPTQESNSPPQVKPLPWPTKIQLMLLIVFLCTFPIGLLARSYYQGIPLCLAFVIGILKKHGRPRFDKWYWQGVLMDDNLHNLIASAICIISFGATIAIWFPIILRVIIFISECISLMAKGGNKLAKMANKMTASLATKRESLLGLKADMEIYIGFYIILGIIMGWVAFTLPLFYWQTMQVKYMLNGYTRIAMDKLASQMDAIIASSFCPFPLRWLLQGLRKLGSYVSKMGQADQQQQTS